MKTRLIILFLIVFVIGCQLSKEPLQIVQPVKPSLSTENATISIAAFNIQTFGKTKAGKPEVMEILARTISGFDIVAIQEIRDISDTAIERLEEEVDALGTDYDYIIGPRLGRKRSNYKEQYAYMYRTDTVNPGFWYTFDDIDNNLFHREPFIAGFKAKKGSFDFILIVIHTDPDNATEEINALNEVIKDVKGKFPSERDLIILGDLNSDCDYYSESLPNSIPNTTWLIPNSGDTTVKKSFCTYDKIIISDDTREDYTDVAGVYRCDIKHNRTQEQAEKVSDHYPV